ncbi:MAG: aspartate/glutamate racemase family protein [Nakamurella sp.]
MAKVAVLHTSFVFVTVEPVITDLISELIPDAEILHFVDSDVLATVVRENGISPSSEQRMVHLAEAAEAAGADVIFSACSSLGPTLDAAQRAVGVPVVKIDQAMAETAAAADRIGILATVPTTLGPTADLITAAAETGGRTPRIIKQLCAGAFDVLMAGDRERHDQMVVDQAQQLVGQVDVIVLAQASMNRLADRLGEQTGLPVLSSPRSGVENLARIVREQTA